MKQKPFTKKDFLDALDKTCGPVHPDHAHCDHDLGCGGGSLNSDGSGESWGEHVCCHCGRRESYRYANGPRKLVAHGPFHPFAVPPVSPSEKNPQ